MMHSVVEVKIFFASLSEWSPKEALLNNGIVFTKNILTNTSKFVKGVQSFTNNSFICFFLLCKSTKNMSFSFHVMNFIYIYIFTERI